MEDGTLVPCDPKLTGFLIMGAINWIPKWFSPTGGRTGAEVADEFVARLINGLRAHAPG